MNKILFDSKDEKFKHPFGAVKTNENICFSIYVAKELCADKVYLIIRKDEENSGTYIEMSISGEKDGFNLFICNHTLFVPDLYFYRFEIHTAYGINYVGLKDSVATIGEWLNEWQLTVYDENFHAPAWANGGIMYQIFPDRFSRDKSYPLPNTKWNRRVHENWNDSPEGYSNDYFCGNIYGIIKMLPYIKSLGVNIIYLNPIFESSEYHRYSTGDYTNTDPYFGTNDDFALLCKECEKLGIKVILDGVFSHTGADSIYFNKFGSYHSVGAVSGEISPYYPWYNFTRFPDQYDCWWGFDNLPNVNESECSYINFIKGVQKLWHNKGIGGWRLDVADELPDIFLEEFYKTAKELNKNALIIGEVWEDATNKFAYGKRRKYLLGSQMNGVMNYPWLNAILEFVKFGDEMSFNEKIMTILENYPAPAVNCAMNSISTHDTVRALTYFEAETNYELAVKRLLLATFLQFTLPGIPCIFYGDEVGLSGNKDPDNRKPYPYGKENFNILSFYKEIGSVRNKYKKDFTMPLKLYFMENGCYSYTRGKLFCGINTAGDPIKLTLDKTAPLFSYGNYSIQNGLLTLQPYSAIIIK